jgi:hypothetical protein
MSSENLLDRGRLGDICAIGESLNYIFFSVGISARVFLTNDLLEIILTRTNSTCDRVKCITCIQKYMDLLDTSVFSSARIYSKHQDSQSLDWWHEIITCKTLTVITSDNDLKTAPTNYSSRQDVINTDVTAIAGNMQTPPIIEFFDLDPKAIASIKRAGGRSVWRSNYEAQQVYEKMPDNIRRDLEEIHSYRNQHDWSHKEAYANGGSDSVGNGDWEGRSLNRARGGRDVTHQEETAIQAAKAKINFQSGANIVGGQMIKAGGIAFGVELAFSGLENFVAVQRGNKNVEEALFDTVKNSSSVAVTAAIITGGVVAITLVFPPLGGIIGTAAPFLQIVGGFACMKRLVNILDSSPQLEGMERLQMMMDSYGIDEVEISFSNLEIDNDLLRLKEKLGII